MSVGNIFRWVRNTIFFSFCRTFRTPKMLLKNNLGDDQKGNFTWNLKAIDEFQRLIIFAGRVENRFSFQMSEFVKSRQTTNISPSDSHKPKYYLELKAIVEYQEIFGWAPKYRFLFSLFVESSLSPKYYKRII